MKKTAPAGVRPVRMGPFRDLRTKKTAPRGIIKDEKDRATWIYKGRKKTAPCGSTKDEKDRAIWIEFDDS